MRITARVVLMVSFQLKKVAKESGECVSDYTYALQIALLFILIDDVRNSSPCPKGWIPRPNHEVSTIFCDAPKSDGTSCVHSVI